MNKIILILSAAAAVFLSSCSFKRGIGFVNDQFVLRDWYGDTCLEASAGLNVNMDSSVYNNEEDSIISYNEIASYKTTLDLGLGVFRKIFSNNSIKLNAGIRYTDRIIFFYSENASHTFNSGYDYYGHSTHFTLDFAGQQACSIVFPDLEIETPFFEGLRFIIKADLFCLTLNYTNTKLGYSYYEKNDTRTGEYSESAEWDHVFPIKLNGYSIRSSYLNLENLKLGLIYYFK